MLTEAEREAIVRSGAVYLQDGLRAALGGWKNPDYCCISSARPGFWGIAWERIAEVVARPDRRLTWLDNMFRTSNAWLGYTPNAADFQTHEDYERARAAGMDVI